MAVDDAGEDGGDDVSAVRAVGAAQVAEVSEQTGAFLAVGADGLLLVDEADQLVTGDAVFLGGPVAPAVWFLDSRAVALASQLSAALLNLFHVVEELEKHNPGEDW